MATRRQQPVELILETSSRNFSRLAVVGTLLKRGIRTEWIEVGRGEVSLLDFGGYHRQVLGIAFPERREAEYRIVIHNEDNVPLAITGVAARGNVYRVVFLATAKEGYRSRHGSEELMCRSTTWPQRRRRCGKASAAGEARLGAEIANLAVAAGPARRPGRMVNNAFFLGGAIVVLVAASLGLCFITRHGGSTNAENLIATAGVTVHAPVLTPARSASEGCYTRVCHRPTLARALG